MRRYGITRAEIEAFVVPENRSGVDPENPLFVGKIGDISICLVLALDDMSTVITLYHLER